MLRLPLGLFVVLLYLVVYAIVKNIIINISVFFCLSVLSLCYGYAKCRLNAYCGCCFCAFAVVRFWFDRIGWIGYIHYIDCFARPRFLCKLIYYKISDHICLQSLYKYCCFICSLIAFMFSLYGLHLNYFTYCTHATPTWFRIFFFKSNGGGGMPIDTDTDININHRTGDRSKLGSMAEKEKRRTENHLFCFVARWNCVFRLLLQLFYIKFHVEFWQTSGPVPGNYCLLSFFFFECILGEAGATAACFLVVANGCDFVLVVLLLTTAGGAPLILEGLQRAPSGK